MAQVIDETLNSPSGLDFQHRMVSPPVRAAMKVKTADRPADTFYTGYPESDRIHGPPGSWSSAVKGSIAQIARAVTRQDPANSTYLPSYLRKKSKNSPRSMATSLTTSGKTKNAMPTCSIPPKP